MRIYLSKVKSFFGNVKLFLTGFARDFSDNLNNAETLDDFKEKNQNSFYKNMKLAFGNKGFKQILIIMFMIPVFTFGYSVVKDDFTVLRNIHYAILSDVVIEVAMEEKDEIINMLEQENMLIESKYNQLEKNYNALLDKIDFPTN